MKHWSFGFVLTIVLFAGLSEAQCPKNVVSFKNALRLTRNNLEVQCKSKDEDLGVHVLKFNDLAYEFSFNDRKGQDWDCTLRQGGYIQSFTAYAGGAIHKCGETDIWTVRDDSVYLSRNGKKEEKWGDNWVYDYGCHANVVTFQNALTLSHNNLEVHCKSTDDDQGVHVIKFNDLNPTYKFTFTDTKGVNIGCILRQGGYISSFIAFTGGVFHQCNISDKWTAKDDSIYLLRHGKQEEKLYDWVKK